MNKLRLILALSGLALGTAVSAAPTRDPPGGPEQLAAMCIQQGCWNPAVNGVTSVYACAGGDLVRTRFNVAANRLDLTRSDDPAVASLTLQHTSAAGPVVYGDGDLTWSVTAGQAQLSSASHPEDVHVCRLTRMEQTPGEGIRIIK